MNENTIIISSQNKIGQRRKLSEEITVFILLMVIYKARAHKMKQLWTDHEKERKPF